MTLDPPDAIDATAAPYWLCGLAFALAGGVLTFGWVGLLLAVNGWCRLFLVLPLGALAWVALLLLGRTALGGRGPSSRSAHAVAAIGVAAIALITLWNGAHASQHVLINRDPGAYTNAGRWIARTGGLDVHPRVGPFAHDPSLSFDSPALYEMRDGSLQFQFAHLLPALLAEAHEVGGDVFMFHLAELLSGIALLAFFVLSWRVLRRPWFALAAVLALAFTVPQVFFSRDSYSEIPSQVLLFTAIWLLTSTRLFSQWRVALAAGLFLGATETARVDALAYLVGVPALVGIAWIATEARSADRRNVQRAAVAFAAGLAPGLALGIVDLARHSGAYFSGLSSQVGQLVAAIAVSALATVGVVLAWPRIRRTAPRRRMRFAAAAIAGGFVLLVGLGAWALRPRVNVMRGPDLPLIRALQAMEGRAVDGTHYFFEYSLTWMSWYLGPITMVAAIVGAALLFRSLLLGRYVRTLPAVLLLAPEAVVYLWKANAVPDHPWVDRRFLGATLPALVLLALGLAAVAGTRRGRGRGPVLARAAGIVVAVVAVAYPIYSVAPIAAMSEQRGYVIPLRDACGLLGPHAAVVVLYSGSDHLYLDAWAPQSLRGWCGADVATMRGRLDGAALRRLSREWGAAGRKLFVVARSVDTVRAVLPDATIASTRLASNAQQLQPTLTKRPDTYVLQTFAVLVARVPDTSG